MQVLYAYFKHAGESTINRSEKELIFSIEKAYDLYHYLLILIIDIADYAKSRLELALNKKIPSYEDLHPNNKFVNNKLIKQLRVNIDLHSYLKIHKLSWVNTPELIKSIYNELIITEEYKDYMADEKESYAADKKFIALVYKNTVTNCEALFSYLEEQSIYWNDEVEFIIGIIIKTIKKFNEAQGENAHLMPLYKSPIDKEFSTTLFRKVILHYKEYLELIEKYSKNWDIERIAFVDVLLMQMAIAEAVEFSSIPVKVTLNEYLELSKYYSTQKSNIFINGILDKIFTHLKENKIINKQGRGLIGEV